MMIFYLYFEFWASIISHGRPFLRERRPSRSHTKRWQKERPNHPNTVTKTIPCNIFAYAVDPMFDMCCIMTAMLIVGSSYLSKQPV